MYSKGFAIALVLLLSGCASSSDLENSAQRHAKARDYYESIGQHDAAIQEGKAAQEDRDDAGDFFPLLVELFNLFKKE